VIVGHLAHRLWS